MGMYHYWVTTPEVSYGSYEEGYEDGVIVRCVEAKNISDAKAQFVKKQYKEWKDHSYHSRDSNWFYHLKVESTMCPHKVCLCEIEGCTQGNPKDPKTDWCKDCNDAANEDHFLEYHNALSPKCISCILEEYPI